MNPEPHSRHAELLRRSGLLLAALLVVAPPGEGAGEESAGPVLDARRAEHLLNRFGFGARQGTIEALVGKPAGEVFDLLLERSSPPPRPEPVLFSWWNYGYNHKGHEQVGAPILELPHEEQVAMQSQMRHFDKRQFRVYIDDWLGGLLADRDPLRDRLTLFWHGFFPTSSLVTLRRYELIHQHHFLRTNALGSFATLLKGMVRDAAMLVYFDNDTNSKVHPNENYARELMELYSLGVGNYTEVDVREAARALTGYQGTAGHFTFDGALHDFEEKTILGQTGPLDGDDLAEVLLAQPACARYVSWRLLSWMEGVEPEPERLERYADLLREGDYAITPWLRSLCTDPEFYREEVLGTRVLAPLEYMVGSSRRLGLRGHEPYLFYSATAQGQQIYNPPSVKGWDEGRAWITSSSMAMRGNCVGLLLGQLQVGLRARLDRLEGRAQAMEGEAPDAELLEVRRLWELCLELRAQGIHGPDLLSGVRGAVGPAAEDAEIVAWIVPAWLPRAPTPQTLESLTRELAFERERRGIEGPLLAHPEGNEVLCRLAHVLLRLPIAQLS